MKKFVDDRIDHLVSDVSKLRGKFMMYISFSNEEAAQAISIEALFNAIDECWNPRSPANSIDIHFDERTGIIRFVDNGRGIPTNELEKVLTTLNSGSNIDSGAKNDLKQPTLGRNGVGTIAYTALSERLEIYSYRGGTENIYKKLVFIEGEKVEDETGKCDPSKHGLDVQIKPSKILGKSTKIVWASIRDVLINLQFLIKRKIKISSSYTNKDGIVIEETYKMQPFEKILTFKNSKESIISSAISINILDDTVVEQVGREEYKRFIDADISFIYTKSMTPYIDSFCNSNNTIDNGHHLDGAIEGICRFFQNVTKNSLSDKEKEKLDIKWEDIKSGLSVVISLNTNMENIFTNQTKHKISNKYIEKLIKDRTYESLEKYFNQNPSQLKEMISIVKLNAKARREGDKYKNAVVKEGLDKWSAFKLKNFDPCTNKGKEYKELYIIEGDSAKGSLKNSRDPVFQALFAIRGVSANVFKRDLNQILENAEFRNLIKVMGCKVGREFDLSKLLYNKIIIASDADVDGLFIRSLLCSFFIKVYPEIIMDGRLFIAEPPLYRVKDAKNPFVINKEDYTMRYISDVMKHYGVAFNIENQEPVFMDKKELKQFLSDTSSYTSEIEILSEHYKINDRLVDIILHEMALVGMNLLNKGKDISPVTLLENVNMNHMMLSINEVFREIVYDEDDNIIKGSIDGKYQSVELSERILRKSLELIGVIISYQCKTSRLILRHTKTRSCQELSLIETLKILKRYQPHIEHRFKGLGENDDEDIKTTIMDPNTRSLIKVTISDIENDMKVFNTLRGSSPLDALNRKNMMKEYKIPRDLIDT